MDKSVDESWKKQVQQEKEDLRKKAAVDQSSLTEPHFIKLLESLYGQIAATANSHPAEAQVIASIMEALHIKTKDNLTPKESIIFSQMLGKLKGAGLLGKLEPPAPPKMIQAPPIPGM